MEVAETILEQLGGSRISHFLGVKQFLKDDNSLMFRFKGSRHSNYCKITLNGMDLYDIDFIKIHGKNAPIVDRFENIYNDQLVSTFEQTTKLFLHF
jgi:hypothetical protein